MRQLFAFHSLPLQNRWLPLPHLLPETYCPTQPSLLSLNTNWVSQDSTATLFRN